jgi:hypothetical protein
MTTLCGLICVSVACARADAGFIDGFIGNVRAATTGGGGKVTGNFAVLDRLSGASEPGDAFGTGMPNFDSLYVAGGGSAQFDTTARYLYLFQWMVSPTSTASFGSYFFGGSSARFSSVTSHQQWSLFLADQDGVVSTTNDFGLDGLPFSETAPANLGVVNAHLMADPASSLLSSVVNVSFTATTFSGSYSPLLTPGKASRIVGYTTNLAPGFITVASEPNYAGAAQVVPIVPEPGALLLLVIGGSGCLAIRRRRG